MRRWRSHASVLHEANRWDGWRVSVITILAACEPHRVSVTDTLMVITRRGTNCALHLKCDKPGEVMKAVEFADYGRSIFFYSAAWHINQQLTTLAEDIKYMRCTRHWLGSALNEHDVR